MKRRHCMYRQGFTLIELLIVISIIGVLAVLLSLGLNGARKSADKAEAAMKLKTVGQCIFNYAADHNGRVPGPLRGYQKPAKFPAGYRSLLFYIENYYDGGYSTGYDMDPRYVSKAYYRWLEKKGLNAANLSNANVYVMYNNKQNIPWGLPGDTYPQVDVGASSLQGYLADKAAVTTAMMREAIGPGSGLMPEENLFYKGIHVLFYDGHVETVTGTTLPPVK